MPSKHTLELEEKQQFGQGKKELFQMESFLKFKKKAFQKHFHELSKR